MSSLPAFRNGVPRIGGPTPPTPPPGILLPDGTPAARSMEPGQAIAVDVVGKVASLPSLEQTLTDLADWRERQGPGHELAAGQRLTIQAVQMVARWRDEAQALVAKARGLPKPPATDAGGDGRIPPNP